MHHPRHGSQPSAVVTFDAPSLPPLAAVRDRADETVERAARLREDGYVGGYEAGWAASQADVERELAEHRRAAERLAGAARALEDAARDLARRDHLELASIEHDVVALATALAVDLVGRELAVTDEPVVDALRRAAALVPDRGTPLVRVHPDDEQTARDAVAADILTWTGDVTVVPDARVEPGGCVVDVGPCRIDAQLGPAIERLRAAMPGGRGDLLARPTNPAQSTS